MYQIYKKILSSYIINTKNFGYNYINIGYDDWIPYIMSNGLPRTIDANYEFVKYMINKMFDLFGIHIHWHKIGDKTVYHLPMTQRVPYFWITL